jgi:hypothetical protein
MILRELIDFFLFYGIEYDEEDLKCLNDVISDIENLENVSANCESSYQLLPVLIHSFFPSFLLTIDLKLKIINYK